MKRLLSAAMLTLLMLATLTLTFNVQAVGSLHVLNLASVTNPSGLDGPLSVPFYYQEKDYYCGPACLQMVFDYYGENISQSEIACVARSIGDPLYVTYTDELRRAGHFSNISTSMGDELPSNITGYGLRQLGYAAFEAFSDLATLRNSLDQGKPLILLMWYSGYHNFGHYRVAIGYNDTHVFLHDPWNKPLWGGTYGGPNIAFNNSQFLDLWSYYSNWTLYVSPWTVNFSTPAYIEPGTPFQVESTVTYPQPLVDSLSVYPASSCNASITLPANLSLAEGENQKKTVGTGFLQAGDSSTLSWTLVADSAVSGTVSITVEGTISGSVWAHANYTAYGYSDRIGAAVNFTVNMPQAEHDVAVTNVLFSKTVVGQGCRMNVSVTVANQGGYTETFNVTVYADQNATIIGDEYMVGMHSVTLSPGNSGAVTFQWNTTLIVLPVDGGTVTAPMGNYTISAYAWPVLNETGTSDNLMVGGLVTVTIPGDVNGDLAVNILDAVSLADFFMTNPASPGWNQGGANADINDDASVNILDAITLANHFNEHYP